MTTLEPSHKIATRITTKWKHHLLASVGIATDIAHAIDDERAALWRPITTAPRDGAEPLLLLTNTGVAWTGHWSARQECWLSVDGGFLVVSHWMPIPELPGDA